MTFEPRPFDLTLVQAIDTKASLSMKRGIRLLSDAQHQEEVREALRCFDEALEMRRHLPLEAAPMLRYGLAACWLNRADALMRLGEATEISSALYAYDEALQLLRSLPLSDDPRFPRRLAIAHQNRGLALYARGSSGTPAAVEALTDAITVLEHDCAALIADRKYLLAAAWMNLANARVSEGAAESVPLAHDAALRAMALVEDSEQRDADAAEVGIKARHVLCQTLAYRLSLATETMQDDVHEATDAVDEGLALIRHWESLTVTRFRSLAYDLFRFGARVYEKYQPQFLHEFVLENIDQQRSSRDYVESTEIRSAAREALGSSITQMD